MELNNRPKAMISDFGTSEEMLRGKRERTGHTGTMEYMVRPAHSPPIRTKVSSVQAPETLITDLSGQWRPSDSHADMWSLGLFKHRPA
jgi:hypothetical protein